MDWLSLYKKNSPTQIIKITHLRFNERLKNFKINFKSKNFNLI